MSWRLIIVWYCWLAVLTAVKVVSDVMCNFQIFYHSLCLGNNSNGNFDTSTIPIILAGVVSIIRQHIDAWNYSVCYSRRRFLKIYWNIPYQPVILNMLVWLMLMLCMLILHYYGRCLVLQSQSLLLPLFVAFVSSLWWVSCNITRTLVNWR